MESQSPVQPGDVLLGRYRVEHVLGQGGMGVVVAARHLNLGQLFAIKFLLPRAVEHPQAVERFLREARAAARLKSEHVAKVMDVGQLETGAPYMVMEHLEGSDLRQLLRARGPLPVDEAVTYVLHACDALAEAHGLGIVHRDIKPANLFLTRRPNGSPCLKVLDFGISKQLGTEAVDLTNTHTSFGSPLYMSPEQMTRAKSVDTRTDIWSIGIVCYELLTATTPFLAESVTEVVGRVLQEEPVRPAQIRPDLPPWLDTAIMGCLQKHRDHRFQTIRDFVHALTSRDVAGTIPLSRGSMPSLPMVTVPITTTTGAGVAILPAAESRTGQTNSAWGQTAGVKAEQKRRFLPAIGGAAVLVTLLLAGGLWVGLRRAGGESHPAEQPQGSGGNGAPQIATASAFPSSTETPPSPSTTSSPGAAASPDTPTASSSAVPPSSSAHATAASKASPSPSSPGRPSAPGTKPGAKPNYEPLD